MVLPVAAAASKLATMAAKQIAGRVAAKVPGAQAHKQMQRGVVVAGIAGLLLVALLAVTLLAGLLSSLTGTVGGLTADDGVCGGGGGASPEAIADIPPNYLSLYQSAAAKIPGLDWTFVAAIGKIETNHGRSPLPGVLSGTNSSGAAGPMQFLLSTWRSVGVDGDGNGTKNVYDPADAIPGAAGYLQIEGAPGNMHDAIFAYNHADWYVKKVLATAALYR